MEKLKIGTSVGVEIIGDGEMKVNLNGNGVDIMFALGLLMGVVADHMEIDVSELLSDVEEVTKITRQKPYLEDFINQILQ